jgi:hypothetical protein
LHWGDGGNQPPAEVTADVDALLGKVSSSGCIMIGEKGMVYSGDDGDQHLKFYVKLKGDGEMQDSSKHPEVAKIPETLPRNAFMVQYAEKGIQPDQAHHMEWIAAAKSGKHETAYSNFDIAAYLTEIILLGCVALRAGKKLEWDGPNMKAKNADVAELVRRQYRAGWTV